MSEKAEGQQATFPRSDKLNRSRSKQIRSAK